MNLLLAIFIIAILQLVSKWQNKQRYQGWIRRHTQEMRTAMDSAMCEIGKRFIPVLSGIGKGMMDSIATGLH